jgi:hypothetical protein
MKSKFAVRVLTALGILALSTAVAQAGDGGKPSPLTSFFVCHSINGNSAGKVVDVQSPVFGPDKVSVKIGNGTLACAWARLFTAGNLPAPTDPVPPPPLGPYLQEVEPNPNAEGTGGGGLLDQLKCYNVSVARKTSGPGVFSSLDALTNATLPLVGTPGPAGTETGIQTSEIRFICGPASYFR